MRGPPAAVTSTIISTASPSTVRSSQLYCSGTMRIPTPAATLTHAVLMVVGKKYARYRRTLDNDPHVSFNLHSH